MRLDILKVGHGFCAIAQGNDGRVVLFDCGHSDFQRPSTELRKRGVSEITQFVVTNEDHDHVSDLTRIREVCSVRSLLQNRSVSGAALKGMKTSPLSAELMLLAKMKDGYLSDVSPESVLPAGLNLTVYCNSYPDFRDTNNLSLLCFLDLGGRRFSFAGDLEVAGWNALLERREVRDALAEVDVFVASHHGRLSGYCKRVFTDAKCHPDLVVISDDSIKSDSQDMSAVYRGHARGMQVVINGQRGFRSVLSTRSDGPLSWER